MENLRRKKLQAEKNKSNNRKPGEPKLSSKGKTKSSVSKSAVLSTKVMRSKAGADKRKLIRSMVPYLKMWPIFS